MFDIRMIFQGIITEDITIKCHQCCKIVTLSHDYTGTKTMIIFIEGILSGDNALE